MVYIYIAATVAVAAAEVLVELTGETELARTELIRTELARTEPVRTKLVQTKLVQTELVAVRY